MAAPARAVRPGTRRGRWQSRVRNGVVIFLVFCVVLAGGSYLYIRHQLTRLNRVGIEGLADDSGTSVMNVLMVGSDSRENVAGDLADATGKGKAGTSGQRSDTIMVLHIDSGQQKAAILSIPRDLYVPIAGTGGKDKINAAFSLGGPQRLIATIQQSLGIEINHYAEVDFAGFERIVNTIGGVKVHVDAPARDEMTGLDIPVAGCSELDGYQALAFVRSRYYETFENGRWVSGSNSDIERITRQQEFIRRIMKKAVSSGLTNPLTLNRLVGIGVDNIKVDDSMSTKDITTLARKFRSLDADAIDMLTLPTTDSYAGGAAVQILVQEQAYQIVDRLNGKVTTGEGVNPGDVPVTVLNGNGVEGVAGRAATALGQYGFRVLQSTSADNFGYTDTLIRYAPGGQARAELLRSYLVEGATLERSTSVPAGEVTLVLGADYDGVEPPASAAPTTAAPSTAAAAGAGPTSTAPPKPSC